MMQAEILLWLVCSELVIVAHMDFPVEKAPRYIFSGPSNNRKGV
jgi:hypothetical protein